MANYSTYRLDDARAAGLSDDDIADEVARRAGSIYNVKAAQAAGVPLDAMLAEIDKRKAVVPDSKPFGVDLSKQAPATSVPGALLAAPEAAAALPVNLGGAIAHGVKQAYVAPTGAQQAQRFKQGIQTSGQGGEEAIRAFLPAPPFDVNNPQAPPTMWQRAKQAVGGEVQGVGGLFEALGLSQAQREAGKAMAEFMPPTPQSQSVLANAIGSFQGQVVNPTVAELATDPGLIYGAGKGIAQLARRAAPEVAQAAGNAILRSGGAAVDPMVAAEEAARSAGATEAPRVLDVPTRADLEKDLWSITGTKPGFESEAQQVLNARTAKGQGQEAVLARQMERQGGLPTDLQGQPAVITGAPEQYPGPTPKAEVQLAPQGPKWAMVEGFESRGPGKVQPSVPGSAFTEIQFQDGTKMRVQPSGLTPVEPTSLPEKAPQAAPQPVQAPVQPVAPQALKSLPSVADNRLNEDPKPAIEPSAPAPYHPDTNDVGAEAPKALPEPKPAVPPPSYTPGKQIPAVAEGVDTAIRTPLGTHPAQYRLVDLNDVKPSHDVAAGFNKTPGYPEAMQPRDYAGSEAYKSNVLGNASEANFDPAGQILTDASDAISGPPIVLPDGSVIGGNGRTMTIKASLQNPVSKQRLIDAVLAKSQNYGIPRSAVEAMVAEGKVPMVVREFKNAPTDMTELRALGAEFNKDIKKVSDAAEASYVQGTLITDPSLRQIGEIARDRDLSEVLKTKGDTQEIVSLLLKDKVLTQNDLNLLVNQKTGAFNEAGQRMVKDAIAARLIDNLDLYRNTPISFRDKLVSVAGDMARIESAEPSYRLGDRIKEAISYMVQQEAQGIKKSDWLNAPEDMFKGSLSDDARALTEAFLGPVKQFRQRMALYAEAAPVPSEVSADQTSMFDVPMSVKYSPEKAFDLAFRSTPNKEGIIIGGDIVPGARQAAKALEAIAQTVLKVDKHVYKTAEEALGIRNLGVVDPQNAVSRFIGSAAPITYVLPRAAMWESETHIAFVKSLTRWIDSAKAINAPLGTDPVKNAFVAGALRGQIPLTSLTPELQGVVKNVRAWFDAAFDFSGMPQGHYRENYFTKLLDEEDARATRDREIGENYKPGVTSRFFKKRTGPEGKNTDILGAMTKYAYSTNKAVYYDALIQAVKDHYETVNPSMSQWQKDYLKATLRSWSGQPGDLQTVLDSMIHMGGEFKRLGPSPSATISNSIIMGFHRAFLWGRVKTAINQLAQIQMSVAETGLRKIPAGLKAFYSPKAWKAFEQSGLKNDGVLSTLLETSNVINSPKYLQWFDSVGFKGLSSMDDLTRSYAYHAGIQMGIDKGLSGIELEKYARGLSFESNYATRRNQMSPYMNNPVGRLFMVFKNYNISQFLKHYKNMKEGATKKFVRGVMFDAIVAGSALVAGLSVGEWLGYEPADKTLDVLKKVPFGGKAVADYVSNAHIPGIGRVGDIPLPTKLINGLTSVGPAMQMGGKAAGGATLKDADWLAPLGVPMLAKREYTNLYKEIMTGREVIKVRRSGPGGAVAVVEMPVGRPITIGQAVAKYFKMLPEQDQKKIDQKAMSQQIYEAKQQWLKQAKK